MGNKDLDSVKKELKRKKKKRMKLDVWNKLAIVIVLMYSIGCLISFTFLSSILTGDNAMQYDSESLNTVSNSRIYDSEGNMIYEFGAEIRDNVEYEEIPQALIDAFVSIEDSRFFEHNGFDLPRFLSSAINNLKSGSLGQGGSTLTMQMIDNAFTKNKEQELIADYGSVSIADNIKLKIQEISMAMISEQSLSKEDIFEYYVNRIWFGSDNNTRGIAKAAEYYFDKEVSELNVSDCAFLAGCINAPQLYNPYNNVLDDGVDHLQAATERRNDTLYQMYNHGYITKTEYNLYKNVSLENSLKQHKVQTSDKNQAFIDQVIKEVMEKTEQDPIYVPMDIYTSLNQDVQEEAYKVCKEEVFAFPDAKFDIGFGIIGNQSGEIIAVAPGRQYYQAETTTDRIDSSIERKQPGSTMKPLLAYASTFDMLGWSTGHKVNDKAGDYFHAGFNLQNSDGRYNGYMSLQDALGVSKNTPAAQAMIDLVNSTGTDYWIDFCKKLGYDNDVAEGFVEQYCIGGSSMQASPIQQASAYSMLANGGKRVEAHTVTKLVNRKTGKEYDVTPKEYTLISEQAAWMTSYLLEKVVSGGYNNFNNLLLSSYPVYGKSGTTDWGTDGLQYGIPRSVWKDEWSIGYTSDYTIAVWSGYLPKDQANGWYMSNATLNSALAFKISKHMLDFCQQYSPDGYHALQKPGGVLEYKGGYIKAEYINKGDTTYTKEDKEREEKEKRIKACEEAGGSYDESTGKCYSKQELLESQMKEACYASGGYWANGKCNKVEEEEPEEDTKPVEPPIDSGDGDSEDTDGEETVVN